MKDTTQSANSLQRLRDTLYQTPSISTWVDTTQFFANIPQDDPINLQTALDYASSHMASWPAGNASAYIQDMAMWLEKPVPAYWPLVRSLELQLTTDTNDILQAWSRSAWAMPIDSLTIRNESLREDQPLTSDTLTRLLTSPLGKNLKRLKLTNISIAPDTIDAMASQPNLASLEQLELVVMGLTDTDITSLANSRQLRNIKRLNLSNNSIQGQGWRAILESPNWRHLSALFLHGNALQSDDIEVFGSLPATDCAPLHSLFIGHNTIQSDNWVEHLFRSPRTQALKQLNIAGLTLSESHIHQLSASTHAQQLETLGIERCIPNEQALKALFQADLSPTLNSLHLSPQRYANLSIAPLIESKWFGQLRNIRLYDFILPDETIEEWAQMPEIAQLQSLTYDGYSRVETETWRKWFHSPFWKQNLKELSLDPYRHTDDMMTFQPDVIRSGWCLPFADSPVANGLIRFRCLQDLSESAFDAIQTSTAFTQLRHLTLRNTQKSPTCLQFSNPIYQGLASLQLTHITPTEEELTQLFRCAGLSSLNKLEICVEPHLLETLAQLWNTDEPPLRYLQELRLQWSSEDWNDSREEELLSQAEKGRTPIRLAKIRIWENHSF